MTGILTLVSRWGEMVKFSHSIFALPFALMATFLAARDAFHANASPHLYPSWQQLLLIVACMVTARSVAMTFNRVVDARIDARNPRTADRPIPAGTITVRQAYYFLFAGSALFVICCSGFWFLDGNPWPMRLSLPVLMYLCFYSYTKRFTQWSHFILGSAIALSPVAAWVAISPASLGWPAFVLMGAVMFWIGGFDIIYACQDIEADRKQGLFSLPARFGAAQALAIARAGHLLTVLLLVSLGHLAPMGWLYYIGVVLVAILLAVENGLVHADDFSCINMAFFTVNGVISVLLGVLAIIDVLLELGVSLP